MNPRLVIFNNPTTMAVDGAPPALPKRLSHRQGD